MKAYIFKIELKDSNPLIWRRVIMPADATYNRLHDIIQLTTNFQGGYPSEGYHLFEFDLREENIVVTNDEEAFEEHKHYLANKDIYEKRLKNMPPEMVKFARKQNELLEKIVKKPKHYKIDDYIQKHKIIHYTYDFGDNWNFTITLEDVVEDYYFGYPTLLDGAETAPPEDVGGIFGYYDFLEIYNDKSHPEHQEVMEWVDSTYYSPYDPRRINSLLKFIKYKKTEWEHINHKNYQIIEDKYRKE